MASVNGHEQDTEDTSYIDELPEIVKELPSITTMRGDKLLTFLGRYTLEMVIFKFRHPDFPFASDIPTSPVSEADCTYSKLKAQENSDKTQGVMACLLRGIIGRHPDTIGDNEIKKTFKKNLEDFMETITSYDLNCSREEFENIDAEAILKQKQDDCIFIEILKHAAYA